MKKTTIAMVGAGGFACSYLNALWGGIHPERYEIVGIIDPYASNSSLYSEILSRKIPLYNTLDEFYAEHTAELVCIASPVQFHIEQVRTAFAHSSHVLCEKPLTVYAKDVADLEAEAQKAGLLLGVGFQWSFSRRVRAFKQDILSGRWGKPLYIKTFISWMRGGSYYKNWHGHLYGSDGGLLMDSIISNAMAHYLHFGLFLLGDTMDSARMPSSVKASLYRAKNITSFDTCSVRCEFEDGVSHSLYLTHSATRDFYLNIEIGLEKGIARIQTDYQELDGHLRMTPYDGPEVDYDSAGERVVTVEKLLDMMDAIQHPQDPIPCHAATTLPFATVCNSLFAELPIHDFAPEKIVHLEGSKASEYVPGLFEDLQRCFTENRSPYELGCDWAVPDQEYILQSPEYYEKKLKEVYL